MIEFICVFVSSIYVQNNQIRPVPNYFLKQQQQSRGTISKRGEKQRAYQSKHKYDLKRFNLDAAQIRKDCGYYYETFLSDHD